MGREETPRCRRFGHRLERREWGIDWDWDWLGRGGVFWRGLFGGLDDLNPGSGSEGFPHR